jgi:internalin A
MYNTGVNMSTPRWAIAKIKLAAKEKSQYLRLDGGHQTEKLMEIPNSVLKLSDLKILDLSNNQISSIPSSIDKLQNLTGLFLRSNKLNGLPAEIAHLRKLSVLDLSNNNYSYLPEFISALSALMGLYINNNQLSALPGSITTLKDLIWLELANNNFSNFSEDLLKLPYLHILDLSGNPLVKPPSEVAFQGVNAIREYFRQIGAGGEDYLYEAKLLVLGEGGAGKTSLARKIKNPNYRLIMDEKSTEGIDVIKWIFPLENGNFFRVNIWDFGGQEIYHTTHQFFLTKRSLYVLVADTRKEDTDFYYWLNVVELLSNNSPLLIIKNEKQDRHREINERQLKGQFENLKDILATNLADNRGLEKVIDEIKHKIKALPHVGSLLPSTWVRVREILENNKRNFISITEYLDICRKNGFTETKDSLQLSDYLHDKGVFLHFQDDPLLKKIVILRPQWGTDAVYKVLDNQNVIRNLGHFTYVDLSNIWSEIEYADMRDELLRLMMKFKLCYEIPSTPGTYIAPQLLTENQPSYDWDPKDNLYMRYRYEFMPKGILTQFIVTMHSFVREQRYVWRSGVIIEKDKTLAEIIEYYGKREIHIRIAGAHKTELMAIITYQLDQINNTYKRLKFAELIPCNCFVCKSANEPYFFHYEILKKFIEDQQDEIQCQHSYKMVNVRGLIIDVKALVSPEEKKGEEIVMTKYELHIGAGAKIDGSIILGSTIENSFIKESFNKVSSSDISEDVKETLLKLAQAVDLMTKSLSEEEIQEVVSDFDTLVEEAKKKKPRSKWFQLSADGLIKAAENVGKVGKPVIELAAKVVSLLMLANKS